MVIILDRDKINFCDTMTETLYFETREETCDLSHCNLRHEKIFLPLQVEIVYTTLNKN